MSYVKHNGLDSREICCASDNPDSKECGISFDEYNDKPSLEFHHLDQLPDKSLYERTHIMVLSSETIDQLIARLKEVKKQYRKQLKK